MINSSNQRADSLFEQWNWREAYALYLQTKGSPTSWREILATFELQLEQRDYSGMQNYLSTVRSLLLKNMPQKRLWHYHYLLGRMEIGLVQKDFSQKLLWWLESFVTRRANWEDIEWTLPAAWVENPGKMNLEKALNDPFTPDTVRDKIRILLEWN